MSVQDVQLPQPLRKPMPWLRGVYGVFPGLALTAAIAAVAFALRRIPGVATFSPMILAILIGMAYHNMVGTADAAKAGIKFSLRRILRFAIILLGVQLTAAQVAEVGASGVAVIVTTLVATFLFTKWFAARIGVEGKLAELIAAGTSICGASAVIATNTVTDAPDEDVAYAVACVTVFGSIAMFAYPLLPALLHLTPKAYGLWTGASIHEIAQVVAAAFQDGKQAGELGTIAKLSRVMMLAPVVLTLGFLARRRRSSDAGSAGASVPLPWFVLGFIALAGLNSIITVPADMKGLIVPATTFLLSMALAAMGLETDFRKLKAKGIKPLLVGLAAFLFIATFSLTLVHFTM
ncbi:MAG TPA: YeiH family protein [Rhizomicrobium sp.]|nr:YeiH family protein [Rhizomicrobium sp.]